MMPVPHLVRVRCHYCQKQRHPNEIIPYQGGVKMCGYCHEWHVHALLVLGRGEVPKGCQECGRTHQDLKALSPCGNVDYGLVAKDGMYQLLCLRCTRAYVQKRRDLFGPTQFGWEQKL